MLQREPRILQISCHGLENSLKTMGGNYQKLKREGHMLLLESETYQGEPVSARQLKSITHVLLKEIDVVFVAAC